MAQATRRAPPQRTSTDLMDRLQSTDARTRLSAITDLAMYLHETLNPSGIDYRYFPVLRVAREAREESVEGKRKTSALDLNYFPVLRLRQRLDTVLNYVPSLIDKLNDNDAQVRAAAVHMLGLIGDSRAYDAVRRLSQSDPSDVVRAIANTSLNLIPRP